MKTISFTLALFALFCLSQPTASRAAEACKDANAIFKVCGDQQKIFDEAVVDGKDQKKPLLVVFGADWCPWCRALHGLLTLKEEKQRIAPDALLVEIGLYQDQEKVASGWKVLEATAAKSGQKLKHEGIPELAVVNPVTGKSHFINTASFEKKSKVTKGYDPERLAAAVRKAIAQVK